MNEDTRLTMHVDFHINTFINFHCGNNKVYLLTKKKYILFFSTVLSRLNKAALFEEVLQPGIFLARFLIQVKKDTRAVLQRCVRLAKGQSAI